MSNVTAWSLGLIAVAMMALASACGDDGGGGATGDAGMGDPDGGTGTDSGGSDGGSDGGGGAGSDGGCADDDGDGVCNADDACEGSDDAQDADGDGVPDGCDACEGSDDAQDADGDGVPDGCDVCEGGDDGVDGDSDGVPDGCDLCAGDSPSILLYQTNSLDQKGQAAVELLGCEVNTATAASFVTDLGSGDHDLLVLDAPNGLPSGSWQSALGTFIGGGGAAIVATFGGGYGSGVAGHLGVSLSTAHSSPVPFSPNETSPIFESPFDVSTASFAVSGDDPVANNGHVLTIADGYRYASFDDGTAIVRSNGGRTFANGFLFDDYDEDGDGDGVVDMVELIANQIVAAVQSIRNEMYALPYDYYEWDDAAANLLARAIDFRWVETPWDGEKVIGMVSDCADTVSDTDDDTTPGGPYMGEYHATVAAAEHAGIDGARIMELASVAEAKLSIGTADVWVFTEAETCTRNATSWKIVVNRFVHRGGRVVFTTPTSTNAGFVAALGRFGTGTGTLANMPYSTVADPFWTGITHPGVLSITRAWNWSGPGLEVLGQDSGGDKTVFRYITRAAIL